MSYLAIGDVPDTDPTIVAFHNQMNRYAAWKKLPQLPTGGVGTNTIAYFISLKNEPDSGTTIKAVNTSGTSTQQRAAIMAAIATGTLTPAVQGFVDTKLAQSLPPPPPGPVGTTPVTTIDSNAGTVTTKYVDPTGTVVAVAPTMKLPTGTVLSTTTKVLVGVGVLALAAVFLLPKRRPLAAGASS